MKFGAYLVYSAIITGLVYPISGAWKCKKRHLIPLREQAQALVARFHIVVFEYTPRETCVRLLGH